MEQWKKLWQSLTILQRISIGIAAGAIVAALVGFSAWKKDSDFKPLYTGLAAEDGGAIVAKLKESNTEFKLSDDGATILVRPEKQAEMRLEMASLGLPKTGRIGFELFDKTNLGSTDFAEQINYRRALEGELERTIKAISEVEQARVHLTFPKDSVFLESKLPAKASVLLKLKPGARLTPQNVMAITHMMASAVEGLTPATVSVLDVNGNLLSRPQKTQDGMEASDELIEYRQKIEKDLLAKINSTLEPLLGTDRFKAGISVECDFTSGEQSEETYDPERSVMTSSQRTEESTGASGPAGIPGTGSNLPRAQTRSGSGSNLARRSETIAYQTSKTVRRVRLPQGGVKRMSASVLLDQTLRWEGKPGAMQRVLVPPSTEQIRAIRDLVSGVIGLTPDRGDQLIVESLPFETTLNIPPPQAPAKELSKPGASPAPALDQRMLMIGAGGLAALLLLLCVGFFLWRKKRKRKPAVTVAASGPAVSAADIKAELTGPSSTVDQLAAADTPEAARIESLVQRLRTNVSDDPALAASVLRGWLEDRA